MTESPSPEVTCPACGKSLSSEACAEMRVLCGKEKTPPPGESYDPSNCKLYTVCSHECVERLEKSQTPEEQKSWIKAFLEKIGDASTRCGIDENDICHLTERITGRREHPPTD